MTDPQTLPPIGADAERARVALETGSWAELISALVKLKGMPAVEVELAASPNTIQRWMGGSRLRALTDKLLRRSIREWLTEQGDFPPLATPSSPAIRADEGGQDRKFKFSDGQFVNRVSGEPIPLDEPIIIFRARDRHALSVLRFYLSLATDPHHQQAIRDRIVEFLAYAEQRIDRMKEPGITHHIALNATPRPATDDGLTKLVEAARDAIDRAISDCQLAQDALGNSPPNFDSVKRGFAIIADRLRAALDSIKASEPEQVMVPREPTEAMLMAAGQGPWVNRDKAIEVWSAMIAASQSDASGEAGE